MDEGSPEELCRHAADCRQAAAGLTNPELIRQLLSLAARCDMAGEAKTRYAHMIRGRAGAVAAAVPVASGAARSDGGQWPGVSPPS